jgi:ATP-dependent DNA helicase PIF1
LIIDEKSIIDLKTLSLIDSRLQAVMPNTAYRLFRGINVLLCGDFFQLPPVSRRALYSQQNTNVDTIKGQQLYRSFNRTVRLTQVMRQQGEDETSIRFRAALGELREGKLSKESWELLCTCIANQLSPLEVSGFDTALRLYFTKAEVYEQNNKGLTAQNMPIKIVTAVNQGRNAHKATEEEADNLQNEIYICIGARIMLSSNLWIEIGLVNGSMGIITDITWARDQDPFTSLPLAILVEFDGYIGPEFPGCNSGVVPVFTELR